MLARRALPGGRVPHARAVSTVILLLRNLLGFGLAAVAIMAAVIGFFIVIAMALVWWQEGRLGANDWGSLRWGGGIAVIGALLAWAGVRLAHGKRRPGEARVPSFTLVHSPDGRPERLAQRFVYVLCLGLLGVWLWGRSTGNPWARGLEVAGWLALVYLGLHTQVLLHEWGHLGAARLLGADLLALRVGAGPTLRRGRTRTGLAWEWRLWPTSGFALAVHPQAAGFRVRQFLFIAGGPLVDGLLIWALWSALPQPEGTWLGGRAFANSAGFGVVKFLLIAVTLSAAEGLVPHRVHLDDGVAHSDGWWLWKIAFLPAGQIRAWVFDQTWARVGHLWTLGRAEEAHAALTETAARYPERSASLGRLLGQMHREAGDPAKAAAGFALALAEGGDLPPEVLPYVRAERAAALAAAGDPERARAECAAALARVIPEERVTLLDAFACVPLLHPGAEALLPDAEGWCAEAVALAPDQVTLRGTQGALFIERGRDEEGETILRGVLPHMTSDADRGISAFYLALVARRRGRRRELRTYRRLALQLCPVDVLLKRVKRELAEGDMRLPSA